MTPLLPLIVTVPLLSAAVLLLGARLVSARVGDAVGIAAAAVPVVLCSIVLARTSGRLLTYWFGGWRPRAGDYPLGIVFAVDSIGGGLALLALTPPLVSLLFFWRFPGGRHHPHLLLI